MRRIRIPASALAFLAALSLSCSEIETFEMQGAWQQVDLYQQQPRLSGESRGQLPVRTRISTLRHREVKAVQHHPNDRLEWTLTLGESPSLSFRPESIDGVCEFRVSIQTDPGPKILYRREVAARDTTHSEELGDSIRKPVTLDLEPFSGSHVRLVFDVAKTGKKRCERLLWASPTLVHRKTLVGHKRDGRANIILVSADTLRADSLGAWGRSPSITPTLDAFAASSDVWLRAYTSINSTNPSFASLMTGLYPKNHGIFDMKTPLPKSAATLAEALQDSGMHTAAVVSVKHLADYSGLRQGFDEFISPDRLFFGETVVNKTLTLLDTLEEPFFLWIHLFDTHVPQNPPEPYQNGYRPSDRFGPEGVEDWVAFREPGPRVFDDRRRQKALLGHADLYSGEVAYLDRQLDRLFAVMESRGLYDRSAVVFVSDHGETMGERNLYFDHMGLFEMTVHVPLMIRWPGQTEGRRLEGMVQHLDLFPTLLGFAGADLPRSDGVDLRALDKRGHGREMVFAQHAGDKGEMVRTEHHKLYVNRLANYHARAAYFFDLDKDPRERRNLAGRGAPEEEELQSLLARWREDEELQEPESLELSDEQKNQLEALGYTQ